MQRQLHGAIGPTVQEGPVVRPVQGVVQIAQAVHQLMRVRRSVGQLSRVELDVEPVALSHQLEGGSRPKEALPGHLRVLGQNLHATRSNQAVNT